MNNIRNSCRISPVARLLLALPVVALVTGCGGGGGGGINSGGPNPTPQPTTSPTPDPVTFAGDYAGGLRLTASGLTDAFSFRINADRSVTNTDPTATNAYNGSVSNAGLLTFTTTDDDAGNVTVSVPLARSGGAVTGTGTITSSRLGNGTVQIRSVTPASPFAGTYNGTATINQGEGAGGTFRLRTVVAPSGRVDVINLDAEEGDLEQASNLINANGSFLVGGQDDSDVISTISGTVNGNTVTGTFQNSVGQSGTFTLQR